MRKLPVNQISEGQRRALQRAIEPDAKVMQTDLGSQTCLKTVQSMRMLARQPKDVEQFVRDRLHQLTQTGQPTTPRLGPHPLAALMRRSDYLSPKLRSPQGMRLVTSESFVSNGDTLQLVTFH